MDKTIVPRQKTRNPGSILEDKFPIAMKAQVMSIEAEKFSGILTLFFMIEKRINEEMINAKRAMAPIKIT